MKQLIEACLKFSASIKLASDPEYYDIDPEDLFHFNQAIAAAQRRITDPLAFYPRNEPNVVIASGETMKERSMNDKFTVIIDGQVYSVGFPQCAGCENLCFPAPLVCLYPGEDGEYPRTRWARERQECEP